MMFFFRRTKTWTRPIVIVRSVLYGYNSMGGDHTYHAQPLCRRSWSTAVITIHCPPVCSTRQLMQCTIGFLTSGVNKHALSCADLSASSTTCQRRFLLSDHILSEIEISHLRNDPSFHSSPFHPLLFSLLSSSTPLSPYQLAVDFNWRCQ